jgi:hypothetical protein
MAQDLQQVKYRLQERKNPDRWEGIEALKIAGERVSLVAAFLNTEGLPVAGTAETYRLGFLLPQAEPRMSIEVRSYQAVQSKYYYVMRPIRQQYGSGFQDFTWDATLARELGLDLHALGAVAQVGGHGHPVLAPVLLHTVPFPPQIRLQGCRFIFIPNETMTVQYRLYRQGESGRVLLENPAEPWYKDTKRTVTWSGQERQGKPAPAGMYVLELTVQVAPVGQPEQKFPQTWAFYYTPLIGTQQ